MQRQIRHFQTLRYVSKRRQWLGLDEILDMNLLIAKYTPLNGSSYIPLPVKIDNKKAIINIKNKGSKCFMLSILAALHPVHYKNNPERIHQYQNYAHELDFDGIDFPVGIREINKFERQNQRIHFFLGT